MRFTIVFLAYHHHIVDCHGNVEAILILNQYDILALEARDHSAPYFTYKSNFIAYFHFYSFLLLLRFRIIRNIRNIPYSGISSELSP